MSTRTCARQVQRSEVGNTRRNHNRQHGWGSGHLAVALAHAAWIDNQFAKAIASFAWRGHRKFALAFCASANAMTRVARHWLFVAGTASALARRAFIVADDGNVTLHAIAPFGFGNPQCEIHVGPRCRCRHRKNRIEESIQLRCKRRMRFATI